MILLKHEFSTYVFFHYTGSDPPVFQGINQGMMDAPLFQSPGGRGGRGGGRGGRRGGGGRNQGGNRGPSTPPDEIEPPAPGTDFSESGGGGKRDAQGGGGGGGGGGNKRKFQFYCEVMFSIIGVLN